MGRARVVGYMNPTPAMDQNSDPQALGSRARADAGKASVLRRDPDAEASLGSETAAAPGASVSRPKGVLSAAAP